MTAARFPFLLQRMFNTPLAIHPMKAEMILGALSERLGITSLTRLTGETVALSPSFIGADVEDEDTFEDDGFDVEAGVARIEIEGTTVMKSGSLRPWSGMTGYDGIRQNFFTALNDNRVKAIMLDIDSPGGEVNGLFDLVDDIFAHRGTKPIGAILTESAYSAGYAIASAVDPGRIWVPRTGGVGSVGVVWMHCDFSEAIRDAGVKVTFVQRGARKVDGAPELPLSKEALERAQTDIDTIGGMFEETVARNRGLSAKKIRDMEAGTFLGANGVAQGLADAVMAPADAFRQLLGAIR